MPCYSTHRVLALRSKNGDILYYPQTTRPAHATVQLNHTCIAIPGAIQMHHIYRLDQDLSPSYNFSLTAPPTLSLSRKRKTTPTSRRLGSHPNQQSSRVHHRNGQCGYGEKLHRVPHPPIDNFRKIKILIKSKGCKGYRLACGVESFENLKWKVNQL